MSLIRITAPTVEPVSLDEFKAHARVKSDDEVSLMLTYIRAARELAEVYTERAFIWQRWRQSYDARFPAIIRLMRNPVIVETGSPPSPEIVYYDSAGAVTAYTTFVVDADADPAVIRPGYDTLWPTTWTYLGTAFSVTYAAGYGTAAKDVPEPIRLAIKLMATQMFDNRTDVRAESFGWLLNPYRSRWMHAA